MRTLVFATHNPNKAREIQEMCGPEYRILTLTDIGYHDEIVEERDTLEGNSALKAQAVSEHTEYPVFSDDTGLEVRALDGAPGVRSARFAGEPANDDRNMSKLIEELNGKTDRSARFRTVVTYKSGSTEVQFEGIASGKIIEERRGEGGFGYDPIFIPDGYDKSFAQMYPSEKNAISHRKRAFQKLIDFLEVQS